MHQYDKQKACKVVVRKQSDREKEHLCENDKEQLREKIECVKEKDLFILGAGIELVIKKEDINVCCLD